MLRLKKGVSLLGVAPQTVLGITIAHSVFDSYGEPCTITSVTDGKHGHHSHHRKGCAWDIRTRSLKTSAANIVSELTEVLGEEFQVFLEKDHIHIEYDPL